MEHKSDFGQEKRITPWLMIPFVVAAIASFFVIIGVFGLSAALLGLVIYVAAVLYVLRCPNPAQDDRHV